MSLKAKIEAVVYAAEEPVTLAQLAGLFPEEALAWQREHEEKASLELQPDLVAELVPLDTEADIAYLDGTAQPTEDEPLPSASMEAAAEISAAAAEAEERRLARQRDREVRSTLRRLLDELITEYAQGDRGIEIREIAGGYRVGTKPEYHDSVRTFIKSLKPPMKLSLQALETLAVIAYKQPVTSPEVSEIRGVDCSGVLGSLISRKLITTAGRKQVIGRPILYKTTKEFLLRFGLKDVSELPSIEEFEKMAGELMETETTTSADVHEGTADELPFIEEDVHPVPDAQDGAPQGDAEEPIQIPETSTVSTAQVSAKED